MNSHDLELAARDEVIAYLLTFTTYGTWLHGDDRGSVDRAHNAFQSPPLEPNPPRNLWERSALKRPPVMMESMQIAVVDLAIREVCHHRRWRLAAVNVRTNHVHVVVVAAASPERIVNDLKSYSTRRLIEAGLFAPGTRVWTRHGSTRYLKSEDSLRQAIEYTLDAQGPSLIGRFPEEAAADFASRDREGAEGGPMPERPLPDGRGSQGQEP